MSRWQERWSLTARSIQPGFTLVEAMMATAVLAIVATSALLPFAAGVQNVNEATRLSTAVALGQAMMEEILARSFFDPGTRSASPGPDVGETSRDLYSNIDDFNGYSESDKVLRNYQNAAISDPPASGLWRQCSVQYVTLPNQASDDTNSLVRVTVKVFDGSTLVVQLDRIVSRED